MPRPYAAFLFTLIAGPALAMGDPPPPPPPPPAPVQEAPDPAPADDLEAGIENFMRNLMTEAQPELQGLGDQLSGLVGKLGPVLGDVAEMIDDVRNYQAPERLENGDIIIRRRADAPPPPPVGPNLRDMMRPAPDAPEPRNPVPERDPGSEIEL